MEASKEQEAAGIFHKILPPRLEDAGLEDCALPPDSIKEAFLKAASAVTSRATSIFTEDDDGDCVQDPWPEAKDVSDEVVGGSLEPGKPDALVVGDSGAGVGGPCVAEKGGGVVEEGRDAVVVVGGGDVEEVEKGKDCLVEGLKGLEIGEEKEKKEKEENGEERGSERPTLAEGFL